MLSLLGDNFKAIGGYFAELIKFPKLMGSVGGWVFVVDVTRGSVGNCDRMGS